MTFNTTGTDPQDFIDTGLVIGCVAENSPTYLSQALRLVQSIRWFGGKISCAQVVICVVGGIDPRYRDEFEKYSASVRIVERVSSRHPQSNKLRFLQEEDVKQYETILLLDCDTIVVQDPVRHLSPVGFRGKIADAPTVPHIILEKVFDFFDLPLPAQDYECTVGGEPTIPYFNAGVLMFSRSTMTSLVPAWLRFNAQLIDRIDLLAESSNFCEQASLSLALVASRTQATVFGNEMNFPCHFTVSSPRLENIDPVILHYHWMVDPSGYIEHSQYPLVNQRVEQFNLRLREEKENQINNRLSWDCRYSEKPDLSSGLGSRGDDKPAAKLSDSARTDGVEKSDHILRKPVFIVGSMRSGTTLLADLLGSVDGVAHCGFELKDIWSGVGGVPMASPKTRDKVCPELDASDYRSCQREKLTAAFIQRMSMSGFVSSSSAAFLNKNPHLCNKLPLVDALFPDARFIWIYRHMPSVVASLRSLFDDVCSRQATWHYWPEPDAAILNRCWSAYHFELPDTVDRSRCFPGGNVRYLAEYWLESNRAVSDFFKDLQSDRKHTVQEETLIEKTDEQIVNCLTFLGVNPAIPADYCPTLDPTRNKIWVQRFSVADLEVLTDFVRGHTKTIDELFPGLQPAGSYMSEILRCIDAGTEAGRKRDGDQKTGCESQGKSMVSILSTAISRIIATRKRTG